MITEFEYYQDDSNYGNYQYITLGELINDYMMSRGVDNRTSMIPRHNIIYQLKRGIRELYYDIAKEIKRVELDLGSTLQVILPSDFISNTRLSYIDDFGKLHPLSVDNKTSIAKAYLQDNEYNILFDNEGSPLTSDPVNMISHSSDESAGQYGLTNCNSVGFSPNVNRSDNFQNGSFNISKSEGVIYFSSDVEFKRISLEYVSDGSFVPVGESEEDYIRIHKFAESAVLDYAYYSLIKNSMVTPANEKHRARKEFYNSRRIAKRRLNALSIADIKQAFKSDSKWVK